MEVRISRFCISAARARRAIAIDRLPAMMRALLMVLLLAAVSLMSSAFVLPSFSRTSSALLAKKVAFKNFEDMIEKIETPLLVDFYAVWWQV
jgi:hypothetical protein